MKNLFFIALLFSLYACISSSENQQSDNAPSEAVSTAESSATGISFVTMEGVPVDLAEMRGKVVLLNFWATWCGPCIREMPSLQALYEQYKNHPEVAFMVIEVDNRPDLAKSFVAQNGYTFPIYSPNSMVPETFLGQAIPTTVLLNKKGEISYRHEGMSNFVSDQFLSTLQSVLAQ